MVNIVSLGAPTKPKDSRANKDWRAGESGSRASSTDETENTPGFSAITCLETP